MRIFLAMLVAMSAAASAVHISEVMYNPQGTDNNREYVEVYAPNTSLDGWAAGDSAENDTLELLYQGTSPYQMVVEEGFYYENSEVTYYSAGPSIGNSLNNAGDSVFLYSQEGVLMDSMSYDDGLANDNGHSLEYFNGTWRESIMAGGTPGAANSIAAPHDNSSGTGGGMSGAAQNIASGTPENGSANTTQTLPTQSPGSQTSAGNITTPKEECTINLTIWTEKEIFGEGETIVYRHALTPENYVIEYWAEDLEGNIVKRKYNTTNTNKKKWTPSCSKGTAFVLWAKAYACNTTEADSRLVGLRCPSATHEESLHLDVSEEARWGDSVPVTLEISKGETAKTLIEVYVEGQSRVSEISKVYVPEENSRAKLVVPVLLWPNCGSEIADGRFTVVAEGLGMTARKSIYLSGTSPKACSPADCPQCTCPDPAECAGQEDMPLPELRSFYVRAKKYSSTVSAYANVHCPGNCTLQLSDDAGIQRDMQVTNHTGTLAINFTPRSKTISLALLQKSASLNLTLPFGIPKSEPAPAIDVAQARPKTRSEPTVYESKPKKSGWKYLLLSIFGLGVVAAAFRLA